MSAPCVVTGVGICSPKGLEADQPGFGSSPGGGGIREGTPPNTDCFEVVESGAIPGWPQVAGYVVVGGLEQRHSVHG